MEHPVDGGSGDAVGAGQLAKAVAVTAVPKDGDGVEFERAAPRRAVSAA